MYFKNYNVLNDSASSVNGKFGEYVSIDNYYIVSSKDSPSKIFLSRYNNDLSNWGIVDEVSYGGISSLNIFEGSVVVGSSSNEEVRLYNIDNDSLVLSDSSSVTSSGIGYSITSNFDYVVTGGISYSSNRGCLYIYEIDNGGLVSVSDNPIVPENHISNMFFGSSVGISNGMVLAGAYGTSDYTGAVFCFVRNEGTGEWEQYQRIVPSDGVPGDRFGYRMSVYGNYLLVSSPYKNSTSDDVFSGKCYLFEFINSNWEQINVFYPEDEDNLENILFGYSLDMKDDSIIIGSPQSGDYGKVFVFSKDRSWGHSQTIVPDSSTSDSLFGNSLSYSGKNIVIGVPNYTDGATTNSGKIEIWEKEERNVKLAQEFDVYSEFIPSKASVFLDRIGKNAKNYWELNYDNKIVIDSGNFSNITKNEKRVIFSDYVDGYTGSGYLNMDGVNDGDCDIINYPLRSEEGGKYHVWIRVNSLLGSDYNIDVYLDGNKINSLSYNFGDISGGTSVDANGWAWLRFEIMLPDINSHTLGISLLERGLLIDKIYINYNNVPPIEDGPHYISSPYFTVHSRIFSQINPNEDNSLFIYDYKSSIDEIIGSGWYNFSLKILDENHGYLNESDFDSSYFLVLSSSGTNFNNRVIWRVNSSDEYNGQISAFKI